MLIMLPPRSNTFVQRKYSTCKHSIGLAQFVAFGIVRAAGLNRDLKDAASSYAVHQSG